MKTLVRNWIRKDIMQFKGPLIVWGLILLFETGVRIHSVSLAVQFPGLMANFSLLSQMLRFLEIFFMGFLTALVVQSDSLVGTTAYWLSRPVPRAILFISKGLLIGWMVVVMPVVFELFGFGVSWGSYGPVGMVVPDLIMERMVWMTTFFFMAGVTQRLSHFFLTSIALGLGLILGSAALTFLPFPIDLSHGVILESFFIVGGLGIVGWHYQQRRRFFVLSLMGGLVMVLGLLGCFGPQEDSRNPTALHIKKEDLPQFSLQSALRDYVVLNPNLEPFYTGGGLFHVTAKLPLERGAAVVWEGHRLEVAQLERHPQQVMVVLREDIVSVRYSRERLLGPWQGLLTVYALCHKERREAVLLTEDYAQGGGMVVWGGGQWVQRLHHLNVPKEFSGDNPLLDIDREWMQGAYVLRLERR